MFKALQGCEEYKVTDFILTGSTSDEIWPLVRDYHYSHRLGGAILHCYAAREEGGLFGDTGDLIAGVVFSSPPTRWSRPVLELIRLVKKPDIEFPCSRLIAFAMKCLRKTDWDLCVSFADSTQDHHGGIYQACSWNYGGKRARAMDGLLINGIFMPGRTCNATYGSRSPEKVRKRFPNLVVEPHYDEGKHLYWKPIRRTGNKSARALGLEKLPYPKPNKIEL